ncbi:MAG: hypothetical protein PF450_02805 [Bacteroidales bacterium]|jgi:hypothetical protein|nr:hypothetical protein [Bacteroidales bacterium]
MIQAKGSISFSYKFSELNITEKKLAEIMGYTEMESTPEPVIDSIKNIFILAEDLCNIKGGYIISNDLIIDQENKRIFSHNNWFETKQIVTHQLRRSEQAAWFVCTAGKEITKYSKQQAENGDTIGGYVLDVLSNIIVDKAMDFIQSELKLEVAKLGLKITNRYSPGYCDWNISEQKKLFQAFPENFMDVSLTESCLMIPIKSVSGLIGIGKNVHYNDYTCNLCSDVNCFYRNKGAHQ